MKKPVIGILPTQTEKFAAVGLRYIHSVQEAGGAPLCLPLMANDDTVETLVAACDGFLFTGGPDVDPRLYGEEPFHALEGLAPYRDVNDTKFFNAIIKTGKPILGICRGIQQINANLGGTLYQDLGQQYPRPEGVELLTHNQKDVPGYKPTHEVIADEDSLLAKIWGTRFWVNTYHHQAVKDVAPGCKVIARATDGVIEAITKPDYGFLYGVQWHPEIMYDQHQGSRNLFKAFVDACKK